MAVAVAVTAAVEAMVVAAVMAMEAAMKRRRSTKTAAVEAAETTAVKSTAMETTTVEAATMKASAVTAATAMANLGRHCVCRRFRRGHGARVRQRQRFSTLLPGDRQREDGGRRNTETAHQPAPQISFPHCRTSLTTAISPCCMAAGLIAFIAVAPDTTLETRK